MSSIPEQLPTLHRGEEIAEDESDKAEMLMRTLTI
jgi:hypothetical protein